MKKTRLFQGLVIALLFAAVVCTSAFAQPKYETANGITKVTLDNGIRILVKENPANNVVAMYLYLNCGSALDPADKIGLSYMMQGLITKGTTNRTPFQIALDTESVGAQVGGGAGIDAGGVYCVATTSGLSKAMDVFFDVINNSTFPETELEAFRARTLQQIKAMNDEPSQAAIQGYIETFFGGHGYGRSTIGTEESIKKITRDDIVAWKNRAYDPQKMVISVVGKVKAEEIASLVERNLGGLKPPVDKIADPPAFDPPAASKEAFLNKETQASWIVVGYPAPSLTSEEQPAMDVLNNILGGGMASRLFVELRDKKGLAYMAQSVYYAAGQGGTILGFMATHPANYMAAKNGMIEEFTRLTKEHVGQQELEDAKTYTLGMRLMSKETNVNIAGAIAVDELYQPGKDVEGQYAKAIQAVTAADIMNLAKKYLTVPTVYAVVPKQ